MLCTEAARKHGPTYIRASRHGTGDRAMSSAWPFETDVRQVVTFLAQTDYSAIERLSGGVRMSSADLEEVVRQYGRTIVMPPMNAKWDVVAHDDGTGWSVVVPMWTVEEGRSDLSLSLLVYNNGQNFRIEVEDLHVL